MAKVRRVGGALRAAPVYPPLTDESLRKSGVGLLSDPNHWAAVRAVGGRTLAGVPVTEHSALTLPAVFAAIRIIANSMAQVPLLLMRKTLNPATGRLDRAPAVDHRLYDIVSRRPNERLTSHRWRQNWFSHGVGWGNGYTEIERNGRGEALALWPLLPDRTAPELDAGDLFYRTRVEGKVYRLPGEDVLHLMGMGWDTYLGYSPIALARQAIGLGLAAESFGASFFRNDARSGGFIMHPGKLTGQAKTRVADDVTNQGGPDNAHKVKVLEEGMKFVATTIPPEDAQFLGTQEFTIAQVARMYGVPLFLLHSHEKATSWGSGLEEMGNSFVTYTLAEWAFGAEQEMEAKLLTEAERAAGYYFKFNFNGFLRGNITARAAFYKAGLNDGWLDPDEVREKEDLNARGGDSSKTRIPLNVRLEGEAAPSAAPANDDVGEDPAPPDFPEHDDEEADQ